MLDYDLIKIFRPIIINGLSSRNITSNVLMGYQPTPQGTKDNTVYFFKINDRPIGSPQRKSYYDTENDEMVYEEIQVIETTFQINTLVKQNPSSLTITASDLCNMVNQILQSADCINTLANSNIGIYRVTEVRNPYFDSFDNNYEANPSFDFTITHNSTILKNVGTISTYDYTIKGV